MKSIFLKERCAVFVAVLFLQVATAQIPETVSEKPITKQVVESQINHILTASQEYNDVKMVKKIALEELNLNVTTLLSKYESDLTALKTILEQKKLIIDRLSEKAALNYSVSKGQNSSNETMLVFGMQMPKTIYHAIMWTLVLTLLIATVFSALRFKKANEISLKSKVMLAEIEEELENFKRNAIEREQKLRRQLQDEILKQKKNDAISQSL